MVPAPQFMKDYVISYFILNQKQWKLVYWDDKSLLFLKDLPKFRNVISLYEYNYINPYNFVFNKNLIEMGVKDNNKTVYRELLRKKEEEPNGYFINYMLKYYGNRVHP